jgi:hypothetical protein
MNNLINRFITFVCAIFFLNSTSVVIASGGPSMNMMANGVTGQMTMNQSDMLSVKVNMNPGSLLGMNADWWIIAKTPSGDWYSYVYPIGWTKTGMDLNRISVAYQGPMSNLDPFEVLNTSNLPVGVYSMYFGVDTVMNGMLDDQSLYYTSMMVTVSSSMKRMMP